MRALDRPYVVLVSLFSVLLVITNLIGLKIFQAPFFEGLALTSAILTYPLTFVLSDAVTEIYGRSKANFMVYLGFALSLVMYGVVQIVLHLPAHDYWHIPGNPFGFASSEHYQVAFEATFGVTGILIFSSMLAYLVAQLVDVYLFQKIKDLTKGKYLWLRNNASTMFSQLIDTLIVNSLVLFWGLGMDFSHGVEMIGSIYLFKILLCALSTPLVYLVVKLLKKGVSMPAASRDKLQGATE